MTIHWRGSVKFRLHWNVGGNHWPCLREVFRVSGHRGVDLLQFGRVGIERKAWFVMNQSIAGIIWSNEKFQPELGQFSSIGVRRPSGFHRLNQRDWPRLPRHNRLFSYAKPRFILITIGQSCPVHHGEFSTDIFLRPIGIRAEVR